MFVLEWGRVRLFVIVGKEVGVILVGVEVGGLGIGMGLVFGGFIEFGRVIC